MRQIQMAGAGRIDDWFAGGIDDGVLASLLPANFSKGTESSGESSGEIQESAAGTLVS